jgi:hypothetical protein
MNRLPAVCLLVLALVPAWAEETTSLTVEPSSEVRYPDARDILNPVITPPAAAPAVKPQAKPAVKPATPAAVKPVATRGWFVVWTLVGEQALVNDWMQGLASSVSGLTPMVAGKDGHWTVELGPLDARQLEAAWAVPGARAVLVKR